MVNLVYFTVKSSQEEMSLQSAMMEKFAELKAEKMKSDLESNSKFGLLNNRFDSLSNDVANLVGCFRIINEKLIGNISSQNSQGSFSHRSSSGGRSSSLSSSQADSSLEGNSDDSDNLLRRNKRKRGEDEGGRYYFFDPLQNDCDNFTEKTIDELSTLCLQNCTNFLKKLNDTTSKEHQDYNFILHIRF